MNVCLPPYEYLIATFTTLMDNASYAKLVISLTKMLNVYCLVIKCA